MFNYVALLIPYTWNALITYLVQPRPSLPPSLSHFHVCSPVLLPSHSHSSLGSPSVRAPLKGEIESDTLTLLLLRFYAVVIGNVRISQSRYFTSVLALFLSLCACSNTNGRFQTLMLSLRPLLRFSVLPRTLVTQTRGKR